MLSKNQIKSIQALHLKKHREEQQLFIVEGKKIIKEVLSSSIIVQHLYATPLFMNEAETVALLNTADKTGFKREHTIEVSEEELKKISALTTPNSALAVCKIPANKIDYTAIANGLTLYLDDIRDPGNLGTIIRVADWFGIRQLICSPSTTELYNPKVIQSTMGSFLRVNVVYEELKNVLTKIEALNSSIPVYGAVLDGENIYSQSTLNKGIVVIGNESKGISEDTLKLLTHKIKIPSASASGAESLNAAIASSLIIAEFFRRDHNN